MKKWLIGILVIGLMIFLAGYIDLYSRIATCHNTSNAERSAKACGLLSKAATQRGLAAMQDDHDPEAALKTLNEAIEYDPQNWESYGYRGMAYRMTGDFSKAAEDFKNAMTNSNTGSCNCAATALASYQANMRENLQKVQFLGGDFVGAATTDSQRIILDPTNALTAISLHIDRIRARQQDWPEFRKNTMASKPDAWGSALLSFFWQRVSADDLLKSASTLNPAAQKEQTCAANFYIGESFVVSDINKAKSYLQTAGQTCPANYHSAAASAELERLNSQQ